MRDSPIPSKLISYSSLVGHNGIELHKMLGAVPSFRVKQVSTWIARGVKSFNDMTDLPLSWREELASRFTLYSSTVLQSLIDPDGTVKLQIKLSDGAAVEAVLLTDSSGRSTVCLSTQVGCPLACAFCKTGSLGFLRNISAAEIIEQFLHLRAVQPDIANIVFMGMGEPLLNTDALSQALSLLSSDFNVSPRRITVSTAGIPDGIRAVTEWEQSPRLALSLTTADSQLREQLMPVSKAHSLSQVKDALRYYQQHTKHRVTLEAVLLKTINTRPKDARALADFAKGLSVVVNLIPWNPVSGLSFSGMVLQCPTRAEVAAFAAELERLGLTVTKRMSRGKGVAGACGQLGQLKC
ncbi:MAG: 23S rRNA (adenine(2503)-C(2))-methyltransferase RlmN [Spirochaetaceae bacterium]|jgi:23S rRNA (adenine2503-C2)-methyltransferase|nr:23S rRNA (adenine(2503)-C(2))-methyltransferase RlmN [Spirochaetaceae bacterium]